MATQGSTKRSAHKGHHLDGDVITYEDGTTGFRQNVGTKPMPMSGFGELLVARHTPQVQIRFSYNLNPDLASVHHNHASSTTDVTDGVLTTVTNGSASSFTSLKTHDVIRYGPGQGALFRGTCAFTAGIANSWQMFGCGNDDEGFNFGYDETEFGVQHRAFGRLETRVLTITQGAVTASGNITITLDGAAVAVPVVSGDTISEVCAAIIAAHEDFELASGGWHNHTDDNISVAFTSFAAENAAGVFSFVDTDTTGVTADTFNQATTEVEGNEPTINEWKAQADWNVDPMNGTGPSGMTLDPTKLNIFQVQFQYLGAGAIVFTVENTFNGSLQVVHIIKIAGAGIITSMRNPSLQLGFICRTNSSYTGGDITMKTASLAGFIQGEESDQGLRHSAEGTKNTTGATPVNILTIHSEINWQGETNRVEVFPDKVTVASEAGKTVIVQLIVNPTEVGGTPVLTEVNADTSVIKFDTAGTTIVGGETKERFVVTGAQSQSFDIKDSGLRVRPGDRWVFAASLSGGADAPVTVTATWRERV